MAVPSPHTPMVQRRAQAAAKCVRGTSLVRCLCLEPGRAPRHGRICNTVLHDLYDLPHHAASAGTGRGRASAEEEKAAKSFLKRKIFLCSARPPSLSLFAPKLRERPHTTPPHHTHHAHPKLAAPSRHAAHDILLAAAAAGVDLDVTTGATGSASTAASGEAIAGTTLPVPPGQPGARWPGGPAARDGGGQALVSEGVGWWGRGAPSVGVGAAKQKHGPPNDEPHTPLRFFPTPCLSLSFTTVRRLAGQAVLGHELTLDGRAMWRP